MGTINIGAGGGGVPGYSPVIETKLVANSQIDTKLSQTINTVFGGETPEGEFLARVNRGEQVFYSKYSGCSVINTDTGNENRLVGLSSSGNYAAYITVLDTNSYAAYLNIFNRKLGCYVKQSAQLTIGTDRTWITGFDYTNPDIVYVIGKTSTISLFKYVISTGVLTTVNAAVSLNTSYLPYSMVCDGTNIYVNCGNAFYKLDMAGAVVTTVTNTDTTGHIMILSNGNFLLCGAGGAWSNLRIITKSTFTSATVTTKKYMCIKLFENNLYAIPLDTTRGVISGNFVILNQTNLSETATSVSTGPYPIQHYGGSGVDTNTLTMYSTFAMIIFRNIGLYTTNGKSTLYTFEMNNVVTGYSKL